MNYYIGLYSPNKAKRDIDDIMQSMGFEDIAVRMEEKDKASRFFRKLFCVVKVLFVLQKGDLLLIQYPFKKYYSILCSIARLKGSKTITLIHDLGTFRRRKLTAEQEVERLSHTDYIIVHNERMKKWLEEHGCKVPMGCLEIFDYLSVAEPSTERNDKKDFQQIVYAGGIHRRKNAFIYQTNAAIAPCRLDLYGPGELEEKEYSQWQHVTYHGLVDSDEFIRIVKADWGLVWDGDSVDGCSGIWGSYLRINNPHKTSFYLRAGLPVIVWEDSAMAPFITSNKLGIAVRSLNELPERLRAITSDEYAQYKDAAMAMKENLNNGFYFKNAYEQAAQKLNLL